MNRVAVIGAGAVGGYLTAGCVRSGASVIVLARGASFDALKQDGLVVDDGTTRTACPVEVTKDPSDLQGADVLLLGVKAHDLPKIAPMIAQALGPETTVVPAINGLPWWFFDGFGGPAKGLRLQSVDPGGVLWELVPAHQVVGSVVYVASYVTAPGTVRVMNAHKLWLGDIGRGRRAEAVAALMAAGGIPAEVTPDLRREVWSKLWGNASLNPLSALARADVAQMLEDDHVRSLALTMMREMSELGRRIGLQGFDDPEARIAGARALGAFRTSMLQDVEAGRPIELGPILGGLVELARHLDHPTPAMDGVLGLAGLLDRNLRAPEADGAGV